MTKDIKIEGIWFSFAAAANIEETGCSPTEDRIALETGAHTKETLLNFCLDGADPDRVQGWRDYVEAIKDHSLSPPRAVRGVKVGAGYAAHEERVATLLDRWSAAMPDQDEPGQYRK